MIILAVETSCDETAAAILEIEKNKFHLLSNIVASQIKIHAPWGGVVPNLAKREHEKNLPIVIKKAIKNAKIKMQNIDLIAVTTGPGLEPCLWTGINFVENLKSQNPNLKIIGINHLEGHIFSALLKKIPNSKIQIPKFPAIALLVSGGHTELVLIKKLLDYKLIGATRDDAAGEAFDKVAKMLKLGYPGGPIISKLAEKSKPGKIKLPRPMINTKDYDFSFSGLKTAVLYLLKDLRFMNNDLRKSICHEFQQAVIDVLIKKTIRAAKEFRTKTIILAGGVAANHELRIQLGEKIKKEIPRSAFLVPRPDYATDNAAMIAFAACFHKNDKLKKLSANGNLKLN
jgi:N6-L-threonylcarbamoyladenine synthase